MEHNEIFKSFFTSQSEKSEGHIFSSAGDTLEKVLDDIKPVKLCKVTGDDTYWTDSVLSIEEAPVYDTKTHTTSWKETVVPNFSQIGNLDRIIPYMERFLTPFKIIMFEQYMDTLLVIWDLYGEISYGAFYYDTFIRGFNNMNDPQMFEECYGDMADVYTDFYLAWNKFFASLK